MTTRVFLLSPARCAGKRADLIHSPRARFELALKIRQPGGAPLGQVFSFLSGLYFRGKLEYASTFAQPPDGVARALVITPNQGLLSADEQIGLHDLRAFGQISVDEGNPQYREPLKRDALRLLEQLDEAAEIVLLGSIATKKYCQPLVDVFGARLHFPAEFAGRGDMSRGGLLLRCVEQQRELEYVPVESGIRHGARPAKLTPRPARQAKDV